MNFLNLGLDKWPLLQHLSDTPFLLVDDGPLIDAYLASIPIPETREELSLMPRIVEFDALHHSCDLLKDITYLTALDFSSLLDGAFSEWGPHTRNIALMQILEALLSKPPKRLTNLIKDTKDTHYAFMMVQRLLLSPVLSNVLTRTTNVSFKGTILARLDRATLGDFDAFVLGNLLISQYAGTVVIPDFGFYAHKGHKSLIRQNRLIAGVNSFDEVPDFESQLLMIEKKVPSQCTPDDAKTLALYEGLYPDPLREDSDYNKFIYRAIRPA